MKRQNFVEAVASIYAKLESTEKSQFIEIINYLNKGKARRDFAIAKKLKDKEGKSYEHKL